MARFLIRRLLHSVPVVVVSSFLVFAMVAASGDPLAELRGRPGVSDATVALRSEQLELHKPVHERYLGWAGSAVRGDLGTSVGGEPVAPMVLRHLGVTLRMVLLAVVVGIAGALVVGVGTALRPRSVLDRAGSVLSMVLLATPVFWLAGLLKDVGIRFNELVGRTVVFTAGERSPATGASVASVVADRLGHLVLPTLTLALVAMAGWSRFQRAATIEVLNAPYVQSARARGLPERRVVGVHALRNALIPLTAVVATDFAAILGGAVLVEVVFAWQGMGRLLLDAVARSDVHVATGWLLVTASVVVVLNLLADLVYAALDPRIRNP